MTPERWQQIEPIMHAALERESSQRAAFLDQACTGDAELRREIESLLAYQTRAEDFIEAPAIAVAARQIASEPAGIAPGSTLGHYQVLSLLGKGGMGEVYCARDTRLGREVAIKVLPLHLARNPEALARLEREARAVATLSHPNILAIHDFGTEQGTHYAVMELLDGETLRQRLAQGALAWREAVEIGAAVADGLAAAHAKGIIHRDLKPENIFLTSDGRVKILDFGLARRIPAVGATTRESAATTPSVTDPGTVMGTVGYMSPEQVRGEEVEAPGDIFALGCLLHEMVAGQKAFARPTVAETMAAILRDEAPEITQLASDAPPELGLIIKHCLEKKPEARLQSAQALGVVLREILSGGSLARAARQPAKAKAHMALWVAALAILGVIAALYQFIRHDQPKDEAISSLAVLPFANASAAPDSEYLSDGVAESLINSLSQLSKLKVIARTTAFRYKGEATDPIKVGRELGVRAVLTGRIIERGGALIIQVDLMDVVNGSQIWGGRYNRKISDLLTVQEEVARQISSELRLKLTGEEQRRLAKHYYTENAEAYHLYLKGRFHWNKFTEDGLKKGIEYYQQALEKDPNYALAHAGLADCYSVLGTRYWPPKEAFPRAKAHAEKALDMNEMLAEGHAARGAVAYFYEWDWVTAERELKRAIGLSPSFASAHELYGYYLWTMGRTDESIASIKRALELDSLSPLINTDLGIAYHFARQYDQAIAQYRETLELEPNFFDAYVGLGQAYEQKGMYEAAIAELNKAGAISGNWSGVVAELGYAQAVLGRRDEAQKLLQELKGRGERSYIDPGWVALIYLGLGDRDQTLAWLEKACEERSVWMTWLKIEPRFDHLRSEPRFKDLMRRVNLTP